MVLFQPSAGKDLEPDYGLLSKWFEYIEPWSESCVGNRRLIWIKWYGIPLNAWSPRFFSLAACKFGTIALIDEDTLNLRKL